MILWQACRILTPAFGDNYHSPGVRLKHGTRMKYQIVPRLCQKPSSKHWSGGLGSKGYFTFGVSLLVGFYGMLRTGEILNIRTSHVQSSASGDKVYLSLGLTKGGKRAGASESVVLGYEQVVKPLLRWTKAKGSCNLCGSPASWRARFAEGLKALGLESFGFRPYSLRRGGATYWFGRHQNLDRLLIQGRWLTQKSARIYINEGLAILASMKFEHLHAKLRPFSLFYLSEQSCFTVPPLEPPVPGRAGGRGKKRRIMRTQKRGKNIFQV